MKKLVYLLAILAVVAGLAACTQQQNEGKEKTNVTEQQDVNNTNKEKAIDNTKQQSKDEDTIKHNEPETQNGNTVGEKKPEVSVPVDQVYQNEVFKDVIVTQSGDEFIVTGKAQVFEGNFVYALYNGDKVVLQNNYQTDGAPAWGEFKITFKKDLVTTNEMRFELFDYSAKDGSKVYTLIIPIPKP